MPRKPVLTKQRQQRLARDSSGSHSITDLERRSDYWLGLQGRLKHHEFFDPEPCSHKDGDSSEIRRARITQLPL